MLNCCKFLPYLSTQRCVVCKCTCSTRCPLLRRPEFKMYFISYQIEELEVLPYLQHVQLRTHTTSNPPTNQPTNLYKVSREASTSTGDSLRFFSIPSMTPRPPAHNRTQHNTDGGAQSIRQSISISSFTMWCIDIHIPAWMQKWSMPLLKSGRYMSTLTPGLNLLNRARLAMEYTTFSCSEIDRTWGPAICNMQHARRE